MTDDSATKLCISEVRAGASGGQHSEPNHCPTCGAFPVVGLSGTSGEPASDVERDCPYCQGQGWYVAADRATGDPVQVQCEFCLATGKLYARVARTGTEEVDRINGRVRAERST